MATRWLRARRIVSCRPCLVLSRRSTPLWTSPCHRGYHTSESLRRIPALVRQPQHIACASEGRRDPRRAAATRVWTHLRSHTPRFALPSPIVGGPARRRVAPRKRVAVWRCHPSLHSPAATGSSTHRRSPHLRTHRASPSLCPSAAPSWSGCRWRVATGKAERL
jgi:hypothetical protein